MSSNQDSQKGQQVDISTLPVAQLAQVKRQLDDEVQQLGSNYTSLRAALAKFKDCITSIKSGVSGKTEDTRLLVPLTTSLYVPGTLADADNVLVDVGTGFFVEKRTEDAIKFYEEKVADLTKHTKDLEGIIEGKTNSLRVVEEVLRQKMMAQQQAADGAAKGQASRA